MHRRNWECLRTLKAPVSSRLSRRLKFEDLRYTSQIVSIIFPDNLFCFTSVLHVYHLILLLQSLSETLDDQYGDSEGWETGLSELNNGGLTKNKFSVMI